MFAKKIMTNSSFSQLSQNSQELLLGKFKKKQGYAYLNPIN